MRSSRLAIGVGFLVAGPVGAIIGGVADPDTHRDRVEGNANAKTNTNLGTHTPIQAPNPRGTTL
ncbi:hypothetical protein [Streptomyces sp. NPDC024089]|uniref:hypothetical protein n=1 Tax=Streptomyces sp. NPDC024089 TaxID=3154328 RepID=UPI00340385DA